MTVVKEQSTGLSWLGGLVSYQYLDDSKRRAEAVGFYKKGNLRFKYPIADGRFDGVCRAWHENGVLQLEEIYCNGALEGERKEWHLNGLLKSHSQYKNGMLDGEACEWYENGCMASKKAYSLGVLAGGVAAWHENGTMAMEAFFRDGNRHGIFSSWDEKGNLASRKDYVRGQLNGRTVYFYSNGNVRREENYSWGRRNGRFTKWSEEGIVTERRIYVNNVRILQRIQNLIDSGELNAQHILEIRNSEVRRVCLEELGYSRFLSQLAHTIIDRDGENELVRIDWHQREEPIYLVKVKCPSTEVFYALRVPPRMLTVKEAIAWTFQLDENKYEPEEES